MNSEGDRPEKRVACESRGIEYIVAERTPDGDLPSRSSTDLKKILRGERTDEGDIVLQKSKKPKCKASQPSSTNTIVISTTITIPKTIPQRHLHYHHHLDYHRHLPYHHHLLYRHHLHTAITITRVV